MKEIKKDIKTEGQNEERRKDGREEIWIDMKERKNHRNYQLIGFFKEKIFEYKIHFIISFFIRTFQIYLQNNLTNKILTEYCFKILF